MSHFNNVSVLLANAENYDSPSIVQLIETEDAEVLADDIVYVITSILSKFSGPERQRIKASLLEDITNHDFRTLMEDE